RTFQNSLATVFKVPAICELQTISVWCQFRAFTADFAAPEAVDPIYHSGQTYYLAPDGAMGNKPYVLIRDGLAKLKKHAIAQVVLRGKEQILLLTNRIFAGLGIPAASPISSRAGCHRARSPGR